MIYFNNSLPLISDRDFLVYAFASNQIKEDRSFLACCMSVDRFKDIFEGYYVEPQKNSVRGEVKVFTFKMHVLSKTRVKIQALISADPKIDVIPQSLLDYAIKKVISLLIKFAQDIFDRMFDLLKGFEVTKINKRDQSIKTRIQQKLTRFFTNT